VIQEESVIGTDQLLVINRGETSERTGTLKVPGVTLGVNGNRLQGLLDLGAGRTVVRRSDLLITLNGSVDEWTSKLTDFHWEMPPVSFNQTVAVLDQTHPSPYQLFLGTDLLSKYRANKDFNSHILTLHINNTRCDIPIYNLASDNSKPNSVNQNTTDNTMPTQPTITNEHSDTKLLVHAQMLSK
jgi:hypothetical protein